MRSLAGRLEVVGGLDPFAQFDPKALINEVANIRSLLVSEKMDTMEDQIDWFFQNNTYPLDPLDPLDWKAFEKFSAQVWSEEEEKWIPGDRIKQPLASGPQACTLEMCRIIIVFKLEVA